jgi:hypothetical protein
MLGLLRLPPLPSLVILLAIAAFVVYRIASNGSVQPLEIIILIILGFALIRTLLRMRPKVQGSENEDD